MATLAQLSSHASPTNASDKTDITTLNEQSSFVRYIPKHNTLIIDDDVDARVDKDENKKILLTQLAQQIALIPKTHPTCFSKGHQIFTQSRSY